MAKANGAEFKIEKGVPVDRRRAPNGTSKYPFAAMEIGDSFFVPFGTAEPQKVLGRVRRATSTHTRFHSAIRFVTRKSDDGIRVWRTA